MGGRRVIAYLLAQAKAYIERNKRNPFFLYFTLTEPHVPRMPATMFKGKSGLGYRGDAILQLDWTVGQVMQQLEQLGIAQNTILIFSSDNGPVLDDGYQDEAVTRLNGHTPAGPLRGGKYSAFEAGTRVPFIISWPGKIKPTVSDALICQVDLLASFAKFTKQPLAPADAPDSHDTWDAFTGKSTTGRAVLVQQGGALSIVQNNWKYIEPHKGEKLMVAVNIESGNDTEPQLYNLKEDIGEQHNLAKNYPDKVKALQELLQQIKDAGRSRK
ncbi:sulfatase-like hydrolase/transferase [Paraflavitalea speifideaquila]|uniref:sulfatase-like hydrolase/transferase n=1 Tax=Paraflavitalea speifideaquila TaxID=3076558 RepID=UPI0028E1EA72|nr:sulfatase-like hydrolase/transferase [Paraflavitalea speifideiaquila]